MKKSELSSDPGFEIVPLDYETVGVVRVMSKAAYPDYIKPWEQEDILDPHYIPLGILDLSFLLREQNGDYSGYCVGLLIESEAEPETKEVALYIADMAVLPGSQRTHRGLALCKEVLRRMEMYDINRAEFYARETTSYSALMNSSHTAPLLAQYGYALTDHGSLQSMMFPDAEGAIVEQGRLMSVKRVINPSRV
jgi:hypothetical protein